MKITHKKLVSATKPVERDALAPISKLVKKLSRSLWNNLKKLAGIDIEKSEAGKNGIFYLRARTKNGNTFLVKAMPVPHNHNNYDLFFLTEDRLEPENRQDVPKEDIPEVIGEWAYERFDEDDPRLSKLLNDDTGENMLDDDKKSDTSSKD